MSSIRRPPTIKRKTPTQEKKSTPADSAKAKTDKATPNSVPTEQAPLERSDDDDHTEALLAGFASSSGAESSEADEPGNNDLAGLPDDAIPSPPISATALTQRAAETKKDEEHDSPGTLYIGRLPHGFYETQMKSYFSQFGTISRLRMSRNRRTGASKHYAFIEFASSEVAQIVAKTMDNYLIFGHILRVKSVPKEQVHENLWKGATGKRFKKMPWNGIERGRLKSGDRQMWAKRIEKEEQRRRNKAGQLKKLGYEFQAPDVQSVDSVPRRQAEERETESAGGVSKHIDDKPANKDTVEELLNNEKSARDVLPVELMEKAKKVKDVDDSVPIRT